MEFFDTHIGKDTNRYVEQVLESKYISEGDWVRTFEIALEENFGMRNVVAVNSCTSALHLALILAGVRAGAEEGDEDEVILPAQTFVATGLAVLYCGAKPVFADIGMDGNIDPEDVARKVTSKTRAVISVSWGGNPCDLESLSLICRRGFGFGFGNLALIQDNAHALGATYQGSPLSEFGDFSCLSFQAIKQVTTGDGGALTCRLPADYERAKRLRWFGIDRERDLPDETGERQYDLEEIGYKYHMNNVAAAIGLGNLHGFRERQERVKQIADWYNSKLYPIAVAKKSGCSYWLYDIVVEQRSNFIRAMKSRGIPVSVVHLGIDHNKIFGGKKDLPVQRYWDTHHVCLPIHSSLTDEDVERVIDGVKQGW